MSDRKDLSSEVARELEAVRAWVEFEDYRGWDPFDGLETPLVEHLSILRSRLARWAWIQAVKRSPVNLRPLLWIPKCESAKGLALCLLGYRALASADRSTAARGEPLVDRLIALRARGSLPLWGYPFSWQGRSFFAPRGSPNLVVTAFVTEALLSVPGSELARQAAWDACDAVVRRWPAVERHGRRCFRYTPHDTTRVHNVNLLAAAQLARAGDRFHERRWIEVAAECVAYAVAAQRADGSWAYGEDANQQWVDYFHSGYNLAALAAYHEATGDGSVVGPIELGWRYLTTHLVGGHGEPHFTARSHWPEDIHTATQAVLTPLALQRFFPDALERAQVAAAWMFRRFRMAPGRYLYQRGRLVQRRTLFLRWTQAWVFRALAALHVAEQAVERAAPIGPTPVSGATL